MFDGPTYLPTGPRNYQPPAPKPRATLAALQWAAERANQSYGTFTLNLTPEDEGRIQTEFEAYKQERDIAAQSRRDESVDEVPIPGGFITPDEDA